jgi:hypothetical protein
LNLEFKIIACNSQYSLRAGLLGQDNKLIVDDCLPYDNF